MLFAKYDNMRTIYESMSHSLQYSCNSEDLTTIIQRESDVLFRLSTKDIHSYNKSYRVGGLYSSPVWLEFKQSDYDIIE